jgi:hypothetical protein
MFNYVQQRFSEGYGCKVTTCSTHKGNEPLLFREDEKEIKPKSDYFVAWLVPLVKATIGETPATSKKMLCSFFLHTESLTPL